MGKGGWGKGRWGNKGDKGDWAAQVAEQQVNLQASEAKFGEGTNKIYESLLDLNVPQSSLAASWDELLSVRAQILGLYGVPPDPAWAPSGAAAAAAGGWGGAAPMDGEIWKSKLNEVAAKRSKRSLTKGEFVFTTVQDGSGGYTSTLSSPALLEAEYSSDAGCVSKKVAEQGAAKAAIQAEFPETYVILSASGAAAATAWGVPQWPAVRGQKRGRKTMEEEGDGPGGPPEGKSQLVHAVQLLLNRPVTKDDVVYETTEIEGDTKNYVSTVSLPSYEGKSWQGETVTNKKEAEMSAAKMAYESLSPITQPLEDARKAKKVAMQAEKLTRLKETQAAKKATREAAKGGMTGGLAGITGAGLS